MESSSETSEAGQWLRSIKVKPPAPELLRSPGASAQTRCSGDQWPIRLCSAGGKASEVTML